MTTHELSRQLLLKPDTDIFVSVDISTGEDDMFKRILADIECVQYGSVDAVLICIKSGDGE